ncbi:MAG: hypothetical protein LAT65_01510 [Saccharospirillum sp.]|nr:hypothetical protein [Saccharospirillum sp.]
MTIRLLTLTAAATTVLLAGCDMAAQDGSGTDQRQSMNGLVVDGRVANGIVWVDRNNNNRIDDFEPRARTDSQGYYSYNPETDTDYCAFPEQAFEYRYCLRYGSSLDQAVVRVRGGIDLATGERLKGVMAMQTSLADASEQRDDPRVLSPISSLIESAGNEVNRNNVLTALGISEEDLRLDFSDLSGDGAELYRKQRMLANAVAVQSLLEVLSDVADDSAGSSREQKQLTVLATLADNLAANPDKRPTRLDESDIKTLISQLKTGEDERSNAAATHLASMTERLNRSAPNDNGQTDNNEAAQDVMKAIKTNEILFQLVKKDIKDQDANARTALGDSGFLDALDNAIGNLGSDDNLDIQSVVNDISKNGATDAATLVENAKLVTTTWGGQWFVLQIGEADADKANAAESYVAVRLDGNANSDSGRMGICANLIRDEDKKNYPNEFFTGSWIKLGGGTLALDIDYEGVEVDGKMKALAKTENGRPMFRFSTDIEEFSDRTEEAVYNATAVDYLKGSNHARPQSVSDCVGLSEDADFISALSAS